MNSKAVKTPVMKNLHGDSMRIICFLVITGAAVAAFDSSLQHVFESVRTPEPLLAAAVIGLHMAALGLYGSAGTVVACFSDVIMQMFFGLPLLKRGDVFLLLAFFAMIAVCHLFMYRLFQMKKTLFLLPIITMAVLFLSAWIFNAGRRTLNPGINWFVLAAGVITTCVLMSLIKLHVKRRKSFSSLKH